ALTPIGDHIDSIADVFTARRDALPREADVSVARHVGCTYARTIGRPRVDTHRDGLPLTGIERARFTSVRLMTGDEEKIHRRRRVAKLAELARVAEFAHRNADGVWRWIVDLPERSPHL